MAEVNVYEAKTQLSRLLARVEAGEVIVIKRGDKPVAQLCPLPVPERKDRVFGLERGKFVIPEEFYEDLPEDFLITDMVFPE